MKTKLFLWLSLFLLVMIIVLAFENILVSQQYFILFYQVNASSTIVILFAAILGIFVGCFSMLHFFAMREQRRLTEEADTYGTAAPAATSQEPAVEEKAEEKGKEEAEKEEKEEKPEEEEAPRKDEFDDDDEVLG